MLTKPVGQLAQEFSWESFDQGLTRMLDKRIKNVHCIGIGGIGVSGLAELFLANGVQVSGSDEKESANTQRLRKLGAKIAIGHVAENVQHPDFVIYSSAIGPSNCEYQAAVEQNIPLISRGQALANFVNSYTSVAIGGTHGKTTTTGLVANLLIQADLDPSYAVGGIINNATSPTRVGHGKYFVAEVDESDASFLFMRPTYAIVTNIDADHLETYGGDFSALKRSFINFLEKIPAHGVAIVCIDDPVVREVIPKLKSKIVTYGFSADADIKASNYQQNGLISEFIVTDLSGQCFPISLSIPGQHNAQNALAAVAVGNLLNISIEVMQRALFTFPGMGRRFQGHGQMQLAVGQATIIEDYGHHPREIKVTLEAARRTWPDKRIVCVFQPHRYTRTRDLYQDFIQVLAEVDKLYLVDVYSAGEAPLTGITSSALLVDVAKQAKCAPEYVGDLAELPEILYTGLKDQDVVILQGAGSIGAVAKQLKYAV